jgi:hypothetical protein
MQQNSSKFIILSSTFILFCQQVVWGFPAKTFCLRSLSLEESSRQVNGLPADAGGIASATGRAYAYQTKSAPYLWMRLFSLEDNEFHHEMSYLHAEVTNIYTRLISSNRVIRRRFKKRYEAGSIALPEHQAMRALKYNSKFGITRDIRKDVAKLLKELGLEEGSQKTNGVLRQIYLEGPDAFKTQETFSEFYRRVSRFLNTDPLKTEDEVGNIKRMETLWKQCRLVCPWLRTYMRLKAYERNFVQWFERHRISLDAETFQGSASGPKGANLSDILWLKSMGLKFRELRDMVTRAGRGINKADYKKITDRDDYESFLREAFWILLYNCRLTEKYFKNQQAYSKFISFLFDEKLRTGEINEVYYSDISAEEAREDAALRKKRDQDIGVMRGQLAAEAQRQLNKQYGVEEGYVLPLGILQLRGLPHPEFHLERDNDKFVTRVIDPLDHTLTAASIVATQKSKNGKCIRLAVLLHDIGKGWKGRDHPLVSASRLDEIFEEDWQLGMILSKEEVAFIRLLVENHDVFHSIKMRKPRAEPQRIAALLSPRREGYELLGPYLEAATIRNAERKVAMADMRSIPSIRLQGVDERTAAKEKLIDGVLRNANSTIINQLLLSYYDNREWWLAPLLRWLEDKGKDGNFRKEFLKSVAWELTDTNMSYAEFEETVLTNLGLAIPENERDDNIKEFLHRAYRRYVIPMERRLPVAKGIQQPEGGGFHNALTQMVGTYRIADADMQFIQGLGKDLENAIGLGVRRVFGFDVNCRVSAIGSSQRGTFVVKERGPGKRKITRLDFDYSVWLDIRTEDFIKMGGTDNRAPHVILNYIPPGIIGKLQRFAMMYRGQSRAELSYKHPVATEGLPGAYLYTIVCNGNIPLVHMLISTQENTGAIQYNKAFSEQLAALSSEQDRQRYLRNIRLLRDFIRNYLRIPSARGCLYRADVIEQLIMQTGGFEEAMEFVYEGSFVREAKGEEVKESLRSFKEAKANLWLPSVVYDRGNLLHNLNEEEWKTLAFAAQRLMMWRREDLRWTLENLSRQPTLFDVPVHGIGRIEDRKHAQALMDQLL